ncbi:MAG TPA: hypothetical protein P5244_03510 [Syntrophales bacterium]|jgi:uncharacterized protein (UPF0332 family)|nr:hypothetical protein [Syntrophales bacterium]
MAYESLIKKGLIKSFDATQSQVSDSLRLAGRDIDTAREVSNSDWAYNIAYNAMLQAARALMFAEGYRPAGGEGQHRTVVRFAELALGRKFEEEVRFFEKMRVKEIRQFTAQPVSYLKPKPDRLLILRLDSF